MIHEKIAQWERVGSAITLYGDFLDEIGSADPAGLAALVPDELVGKFLEWLPLARPQANHRRITIESSPRDPGVVYAEQSLDADAIMAFRVALEQRMSAKP